jgi:hypothetical protein
VRNVAQIENGGTSHLRARGTSTMALTTSIALEGDRSACFNTVRVGATAGVPSVDVASSKPVMRASLWPAPHLFDRDDRCSGKADVAS